MNAAVIRRGAAINELHFTYKHLNRMLPDMVRRAPEPVAEILNEQSIEVDMALQRLTLVATKHGQPPTLRLCAEAATLLDRLYHADRATTNKDARGLATIDALKSVRAFLAVEWGRLMDALPGGLLPDLRSEAMELQLQEMTQHQELVVLAQKLRAEVD